MKDRKAVWLGFSFFGVFSLLTSCGSSPSKDVAIVEQESLNDVDSSRPLSSDELEIQGDEEEAALYELQEAERMQKLRDQADRAAPLPAKTKAFDNFYVGKHAFGVNRVNEGERTATATIEKKDGSLFLVGEVRSGSRYLYIEGEVYPVTQKEFFLDGYFIGKPDSLMGTTEPSAPQRVDGHFKFVATKKRRFWRMYEINGEDEVCSDKVNKFCYIDIGFDPPPVKAAVKPHAHATHRFKNAKKWAARFNSPERAAWQKPDEVVSLMGIKPGMVVADIGTGTGYFLPLLSEAVGATGKVLGRDVEKSLVRFTSKRIKQEKLDNVDVKQIPYESAKLGDSSVDRVLIVNTWHHILDHEKYIADLAKAVKPGGSVWIVDYTMDSDTGPAKASRLSAETVEAELARQFDAEVMSETLPRQYIVMGIRRGGSNSL